MFKLSAAVSLVFVAGCLTLAPRADAAHLVRDINAGFGSASGSVGDHAELGNVMVFALDDGIHGPELWSSDGSPAGTHLVRDINPGPAGSDMLSFTVVNGTLYFWADDGTNGVELWRSDGTAGGTFIVADIGPGKVGANSTRVVGRPITTLQGILYFMADDTQSGPELWRSDGTRAGTYRLADIQPGAAGSQPENFFVVGANILFAAADSEHGREVWRTDGTVAGTIRVSDIRVGPPDGIPHLFGAIAGSSALFFGADDGVHGFEPWVATANSARMAADLNTQPDPSDSTRNSSSHPHSFMALGDGAVFAAYPGTPGHAVGRIYRYVGNQSVAVVTEMQPYANMFEVMRFADRTVFQFGEPSDPFQELWVTDGTAPGTEPLRSGGVAVFPANTTQAVERIGDAAFFYARTGAPGNDVNLWRTDGTSAGTREYAQVPQPLVATALKRIGSLLYFPAGRFADPGGNELWVSDGTPAGTRRVADINPGPGDSQINGMFTALGKLFFMALDATTGGELWVSDGTGPGTMGLGDLNPTIKSQNSDPFTFVPFGNGILFLADDGISGREPWFSDGTTNGTLQLADIAPGRQPSQPFDFVDMGSFVLFAADDNTSGYELWRTDGTTSGTQQVIDILPGHLGSGALTNGGAVVLDGIAYFAAADAINSFELWRSDGTAAGTSMVADLTPGNAGSHALPLGAVGQQVLFRYQNSERGRLWSTDGTAAGSVQIRDDVTITSASRFQAVMMNGQLYFSGTDDLTGDTELWRSDGTAAGTQPVTDLIPGESLLMNGIRVIGDRLVIDGCVTGSGTSGCGLYGSDGTNAGTHRIFDSTPGSNLASDGSRFFFFTNVGQRQIIVTDGSPSGTRPFLPGVVDFGGEPHSPVWFAGGLMFTVNDVQRGPVIWRSDGSIAGTRRILDIDPDVAVDRPPSEYTAVGSRLFFAASHIDTGNELYVIDDDRPFANADSVHTSFNQAIRIAVLDNDAAFEGTIDRDSLQIVTAPQSGTASVDSATAEIVYTPGSGFSGMDRIEYRVRDDQGRTSDAATVLVVVGAIDGDGPGTAPTPPPPPPPPPPPSNPGSSGGGKSGGGSADWLALIVLASVGAVRRRRNGTMISACSNR